MTRSSVSESKPVRVLYAVSAVAVAAPSALAVIPGVPGWIAATVGACGLLLTIGLGRYTQDQVTPTENVAARQLPSGKVIAGPAAEQRDGTAVVVKQDLSRGAEGAAFGEPFDAPPPTPGH